MPWLKTLKRTAERTRWIAVRTKSLRDLAVGFWRDEVGAWFIALLVGLALNVVAYLLLPRPKQDKPEAAKDMDNPTADAGRPIPVVFGTVMVKGLNVLWFGDKNHLTWEIKV